MTGILKRFSTFLKAKYILFFSNPEMSKTIMKNKDISIQYSAGEWGRMRLILVFRRQRQVVF